MTINENVDEIEILICSNEITKEQVFTRMKYFVQQLQNTSSISENKPCDSCGSTEGTYSLGECCRTCHCES
jgi:hypothetical protein